MSTRFSKVYKNKVVVVTGHTGFKGTWLCAWLRQLGARVIGISDAIPTSPSHFESAKFSEHVEDHRIDIRDLRALKAAIENAAPDFVFHLAAQPLVRRSYRLPTYTFETNIMGTANVLESLRSLEKRCCAIMITSDKCYDNQEWLWGYRETDRLGGKDPYSASKAAAELVIRSYIASFFNNPDRYVRIATARAGNVIGGGDWAEDRLVPDCMRAWSQGRNVEIRNPGATRPWQHVLDPLSGYLLLGAQLQIEPTLHGEAFNFGPPADYDFPVEAVMDAMTAKWPGATFSKSKNIATLLPEAGLLKLNCEKAIRHLHWYACLTFNETIDLTINWYRKFYAGSTDMYTTTTEQIAWHTKHAQSKGIEWAL